MSSEVVHRATCRRSARCEGGRRMIPVVILAAGASRRLGRPKQMEEIGGESLLARSVRVAAEAQLGPVYVVVSSADAAVIAGARGLRCEVILNGHAAEGMATSIRAGVGALGGAATGAIVMTCDQPAVSPAHLRLLAAEADGGVVASAYAGRRGVPAYFPVTMFGKLMELRGDAGARELLRDVCAVALKGGETDVDSEEDLERARAMFGGE